MERAPDVVLVAMTPPYTQRIFTPILIHAGFPQATFLANQIRKLQEGRPTVEKNDAWSSTAKEQPQLPCHALGTGEGEV